MIAIAIITFLLSLGIISFIVFIFFTFVMGKTEEKDNSSNGNNSNDNSNSGNNSNNSNDNSNDIDHCSDTEERGEIVEEILSEVENTLGEVENTLSEVEEVKESEVLLRIIDMESQLLRKIETENQKYKLLCSENEQISNRLMNNNNNFNALKVLINSNLKSIDTLIAVHKAMLIRQNREQFAGFMLEFDTEEMAEIVELQDVLRKIRNPLPLAKAIYEIYYRDKMAHLVRVMELDGVSGIYRIWIEKDGQDISYVGQSVDIGARWAQHIKRMVGVEEKTGIMLYVTAQKYGIENLHWECIEKCSKELLSEREKWWGNYYAVKEVGMNKKLG